MYSQFAEAAPDVLLSHLQGEEVPTFSSRH
jgi:hypothetical protein